VNENPLINQKTRHTISSLSPLATWKCKWRPLAFPK